MTMGAIVSPPEVKKIYVKYQALGTNLIASNCYLFRHLSQNRFTLIINYDN